MSHKHDEKPPQRQNPVKLFTAFHTPGPRWPGALRAALALLIPGGIALLLGYETEMLLIAAGGFTVIYGEGHPYRKRLKVMATAGALLATGAMSGAFIGEVVWGQIASGGSHWWLLLIVVFVTVLATVGTWIQNSLRLPPPRQFLHRHGRRRFDNGGPSGSQPGGGGALGPDRCGSRINLGHAACAAQPTRP